MLSKKAKIHLDLIIHDIHSPLIFDFLKKMLMKEIEAETTFKRYGEDITKLSSIIPYRLIIPFTAHFNSLPELEMLFKKIIEMCGEKIEECIQNILCSPLTGIQRENIKSGVLKMPHLEMINQMFEKGCILIAHTHVANELRIESIKSDHIRLFSQAKPLTGHTATIHGIDIIESRNITPERSIPGDETSQMVYPSYVIGKGLLGVSDHHFRVEIKQQRIFVTFFYTTIVLDSHRGMIIFSTARAV